MAPSRAGAAGVVGTGTAASCTDAALDTALEGGGPVTFDCGGPVTIVVASRKEIAVDTTINGGGAITLDGGDRSGVFRASAGVALTVEGLAMTRAAGTGAILTDGGPLTVVECRFVDNHFTAGLILVRLAGAIQSTGPLTVADSTFAGNHGGVGGAILAGGPTTITGSTFTANSADRTNEAFTAGGAIVVLGDGSLTVANSTFVDNRFPGGPGGGAIAGERTDASLTIANSTFVGNGIGDGAQGPAIFNGLIANSILANGSAADNCSGSITDGGHNLDDGISCGFSEALGSFSYANPGLDPVGLADHGGATQTIAPLPFSPAIGTGDAEICANAQVNGLDQRGFGRPGIGHRQCSIGAHEADAIPLGPCAGDCDRDGRVAINELILGVGIALGGQVETACPAFADGQGVVNIAHLIGAVNNALSGCRAPSTAPLAVGVPVVDEVEHRGSRFYSGAVKEGVAYSVSIVGLSAAANIAVFRDPSFTFEVCATAFAHSGPKECFFTASGDTAFVRVHGQRAAVPQVAYTVLLIERAAVASPVAEGTRDEPVAVVAGVPWHGQVSPRGTSYYVATDLSPAESHVVALTALTEGADLQVFGDDTYSLELDCTYRDDPDVVGTAQDCTVSGRSTLYFAVRSGAVNRDGAAYVVLVE
ncbi:MAG: choice-of-anchor Q domain-containing protein [Candidatus Binatia bacterium]